MDSITQAVLGASVQAALLGRWQGRKALLYGAALGTLPDLDVVIDYGDAVANMTYHRGFSHSLFVVSAVALLLTALIRRWRPDAGYSGTRLLLTLWLVLLTHVLLDAFTSYGTQLLWPLPTPPIAWSSVFIIDPLYSVPLLLAVLVGGLFVQAMCIATYLAVAQLGEFYALSVVFGLAYGGGMPLYAVLVREFFGARIMGTVFGAVSAFASLGMALGPWAGGLVFDNFQRYTWLHAGSFAIGLAAVAVALSFPTKRRPSLDLGRAAA